MKIKIEIPVEQSGSTITKFAKVVEVEVGDTEIDKLAQIIAVKVAHEIFRLVEIGNDSGLTEFDT